MCHQSNIGAYRQNSVLSMSQEELVPFLYEHLLVGLKRAVNQIRERDIEGKAASIEKASGILYELLASLDFEVGGEVAKHLASLYGFFLKELTEASRTLDADRIEPLIEMAGTLHEAWKEVTETAIQDRAQVRAGGA